MKFKAWVKKYYPNEGYYGDAGDNRYYVEVLEYASGGREKMPGHTVIKRIGPMTKKGSDRVTSLINLSLKHDVYFTRIVEDFPEEADA